MKNSIRSGVVALFLLVPFISSATTTPVYPPGCTSFTGYSVTTGQSCVKPNIASISPTQINLGTSTVITLKGANFNPTLSIGLTGPGADIGVSPMSISPDKKTMTFAFPANIVVPGNYLVQILNFGVVTYDTIHLKVLQPAAPTLTVSAPAAGAKVYKGQQMTVAWSAVSANSRYTLVVNGADGRSILSTTYSAADAFCYAGTTCSVSLATPNVVPQNVTLSVYDISGRYGTSGVFAIASAPKVIPPSVTVFYPNGGEVLNNSGSGNATGPLGSVAMINWRSTNLGSQTVNISLIDTSGVVVKRIATNLPSNNNGSYPWGSSSARTTDGTGSYLWQFDPNLPNGSYKVVVSTADNNPLTTDQSNNYFTVTVPTTGSLTVSTASDNPPAALIAVASSLTTGVKMLSFNLTAKNQNLTVDVLTAKFSTSDDNLSDVVATAYLMRGSTILSTKTLGASPYGFVSFDGLNQTIAQGSTVNYTIVVNLKGNTAYADGTTLSAATTVTGWNVFDTNGAVVVPSAEVAGNTMILSATGMSVILGAPSATVIPGSIVGQSDAATYTIPFTVTAGDTDLFIGGATTRTASTSPGPNGGITFDTTTSSTPGAVKIDTSYASSPSVVTGDNISAYKVLAGTSRTFALNVHATATLTGFTGIRITGINYSPTSTMGSTYYTSNLGAFKTNDVYLAVHAGTVLGASDYVFTQYLQLGSTGNEVSELQKKLTSLGLYNAGITGYFGPMTGAAVSALQSAHNIEMTGTVGPLTRAALNQ